MEFLEINEIWAWAEQHGLAQGDGFAVKLPDLPSIWRRQYASGDRSGSEELVADDFTTRLGSWDDCLVWIREWGVWPSTEDWPQFYAWRGSLGERRSLEKAPGHRFDRGEIVLLGQLLTLIMENAWDADILCTRQGRADRVRGEISHDEWCEIFERT